MDNQPNTVETLFKKTGDYLEGRIDLMKLQAVNKTSEIVSSLVSNVIILLIVILMLLILNIGIAFWLGDITGKTYYGFFIVSAFYLVLGLVLYTSRDKWLKIPVQDKMVKRMLDKD